MPKQVYVIGHKNPDSDSICSAIAYANLKSAVGEGSYIPTRLGAVARETLFILDYFRVEAPELIGDVKGRVTDMLNGEAPIGLLPTTPLKELGIIISANKDVKTIPIVDTENHLLGIVTLGDIAKKYMEELGVENLGKMEVSLANVIRTIGGEVVVGEKLEAKIKGKVLIGAMEPDTLKDYVDKGDMVLLGNRENAQLAAIEAGACCLVVTGGFTISAEVKKQAHNKGVSVIVSPYDTFATARLINMSIPIESMMKPVEDIITFSVDDLVDDVRKVMLDTRFRNYPVVDAENRLVGVISRYHLLTMSKKKVILVDHNEAGQAVDGLEQAEVLEVIDHHRLGSINTVEPIYFRNEPVGCTSTIVATMYKENGVAISKEMAGLMLGAILSDTVIFKSPTCTDKDKQIANELAQIAGVEIEEFGREMYKAGTSLVGRTPEEIIFQDFKEFKMGNYTLGIGQVETMDGSSVEGLRTDLLQSLESIRKENGHDLGVLMVTDILAEGTEMLVVGEAGKLVAASFGSKLEGRSFYLPGVMSRKKQVVPPMTKYFSNC